ncbi:cobalamin biosynthesis protein CobG [Kitasatospora sp. NPDC058032]|uniref:cobalamin biosynthesis protein CobG n=1 Tax=Kitasatospora sp. NPDC058032 TaxID=3346307 RepID=UPI0036DC85B3
MPPEPDAAAPGAAVPDRALTDACPGALRLHPADDGALARVRLPGGMLTVRQALALADAAQELGDGRLEITSRGNVQLRGLASDCGGELGGRLRAAGLLPSDTHERVRNIVASPGPAPGLADVHAWARDLDLALCASPWATGLSGKFLFALDGGGGDVAALDADVTLIAGPDGTALLRLGRAATVRPVPAGSAPAAALEAARAFLEAQRAAGVRAWHLREVPELLAPGPLPMPVLPGTRPPLGAVSGGGASTGPNAGPHGSHAGLHVGLRFGLATAGQWRTLVDAAEGGLRLTPWRGAVLPGAGAGRLAGLAAAGFRTEAGTAWDGASACTGLPGCAKSQADVRADAARALDGAPAGPGGLPVHWSGCERRCGHPAGRRVDVLATGRGYRVAVEGAPQGRDTAVEVTNEEMAAAVAAARRTTT